jgi:hypothetical protein
MILYSFAFAKKRRAAIYLYLYDSSIRPQTEEENQTRKKQSVPKHPAIPGEQSQESIPGEQSQESIPGEQFQDSIPEEQSQESIPRIGGGGVRIQNRTLILCYPSLPGQANTLPSEADRSET